MTLSSARAHDSRQQRIISRQQFDIGYTTLHITYFDILLDCDIATLSLWYESSLWQHKPALLAYYRTPRAHTVRAAVMRWSDVDYSDTKREVEYTSVASRYISAVRSAKRELLTLTRTWTASPYSKQRRSEGKGLKQVYIQFRFSSTLWSTETHLWSDWNSAMHREKQTMLPESVLRKW